jgi:hypothetical protein
MNKKSNLALLKYLIKGNQLIYLEYPVEGKSKYIVPNGNPVFEQLLISHIEKIQRFGDLLESQINNLKTISFSCVDETSPYWKNETLSALDGASLYTIIHCFKPRNVVEIGSGNSTKFIRKAANDLLISAGNQVHITSIDPNPRAYVDVICDEVHRTTLEYINLDIFTKLDSGDFIFFDGSHRCFQNNDVSIFFLEILPNLKKGVLVGIHDIWLPYDYPSAWEQRFYSEQIVLGAYWIGRGKELNLVASNMYAAKNKSLNKQYQAFLDRLGIDVSEIYRDGGLFLIKI